MSPLTFDTWVELGLKGAVVLLTAAVACGVLRRASAASRHLVWAAAVVAVLALPALSAVVPDLPLPLASARLESTLPQVSVPLARRPAKPPVRHSVRSHEHGCQAGTAGGARGSGQASSRADRRTNHFDPARPVGPRGGRPACAARGRDVGRAPPGEDRRSRRRRGVGYAARGGWCRPERLVAARASLVARPSRCR